MTLIALLLTAWLFGGMAAYSAGFAPVLFKTMAMSEARRTLRGAFPLYYAGVIGLAVVAALFALFADGLAALFLLAIAGSTVWARQDLMGRINAATDAGEDDAFRRLHGASVALQLLQLVLAAGALVRIAAS